MTVSGPASSYPQFPAITPQPGALAPERTHRPERPRNDFDQLTDADRALIREVTGQRIGPGFDPAREAASPFAAGIAADRAAGRLAPGQEVTAVYLKDLSRRFARSGGPDPIAPYLDKATAYLARTGRRSFDVSA